MQQSSESGLFFRFFFASIEVDSDARMPVALFVESWNKKSRPGQIGSFHIKAWYFTRSLGCSDIPWGNCSFKQGSLRSYRIQGIPFQIFQILNFILLNKTLNLLSFGMFIFQLMILFNITNFHKRSFFSRDIFGKPPAKFTPPARLSWWFAFSRLVGYGKAYG